MQLLHLHHTNPVSWYFMPQAIKRVMDFARDMDFDITPELMEEMVRVNFAAANPLVLTLVAVVGSQVVGHLVASIDSLNNYQGVKVKRYLTILQAEQDKDHPMDDEFRAAVMAVLKEWAKMYDCDMIQLLCEGEWRVKLFRDRYGFRVHKTIMHMDVD
jgi:hypothetical protein